LSHQSGVIEPLLRKCDDVRDDDVIMFSFVVAVSEVV